MSQYTSYYLYQKYEQRDGQAPIPVYPNVFSVDGDGTMQLVVKQTNDQNCGYVPPVTPIYRWVNIPLSSDYICEDCSQKRTIKTGTTCIGYDKYELVENQSSYDSGVTWVTTSTETGDLIEENSEDCGYMPNEE